MYANIRGYGSKYLRWVSYINYIMRVYRIYQASRRVSQILSPRAPRASSPRSFLSLPRRRIEVERRTVNKVHENAINRLRRERRGRKESHLSRYTAIRCANCIFIHEDVSTLLRLYAVLRLNGRVQISYIIFLVRASGNFRKCRSSSSDARE